MEWPTRPSAKQRSKNAYRAIWAGSNSDSHGHCLVVAYSTRCKSQLALLVLPLTVMLALASELENPQTGFIRVEQQSMENQLDLRTQTGRPIVAPNSVSSESRTYFRVTLRSAVFSLRSPSNVGHRRERAVGQPELIISAARRSSLRAMRRCPSRRAPSRVFGGWVPGRLSQCREKPRVSVRGHWRH